MHDALTPRVLVTGGTGYVGRRTVPMLVKANLHPVVITRSEASARIAESMGATSVVANLDDKDSLSQAFAASNASVLVNIASLGFGHAPNIVAACHAAHIKRAIFVSTTAIFTTLNAASKTVRTEAERQIEASGLDYTILRPTMIYGGPDDRNIARLVQLIRRIRFIPVPGAMRLQQPVFVDDVASAIVGALTNSVSIGRSYNIGGPEPLTFKELVDETRRATGRSAVLLRLPVWPLIALSSLVEKTGLRLPIKMEQFQRLAEDKQFDISAAVRDFGFRPRSFSSGIRDSLESIDAATKQRPGR